MATLGHCWPQQSLPSSLPAAGYRLSGGDTAPRSARQEQHKAAGEQAPRPRQSVCTRHPGSSLLQTPGDWQIPALECGPHGAIGRRLRPARRPDRGWWRNPRRGTTRTSSRCPSRSSATVRSTCSRWSAIPEQRRHRRRRLGGGPAAAGRGERRHVAAMIDGEATVKTFKCSGEHVWLMPHNPLYTPIPGDEAAILGRGGVLRHGDAGGASIRLNRDDTHNRHQQAWTLPYSGRPWEYSVGHGPCWTAWLSFANEAIRFAKWVWLQWATQQGKRSGTDFVLNDSNLMN